MGNVDEELLYAIRAMEVLLQSGVGIAEAMKHVADEDYGDLSVEFGRIFKAIDAGAGMSEAVRKQMRATSSAGLRHTLSVLAMSIEQDTNVIDRLRSIADKESRSRRIELQAFVESLSAVSEQFLIISVLVPIIVVIMAVIDALVGGAGGAFGGNMPRMPPACTPFLQRAVAEHVVPAGDASDCGADCAHPLAGAEDMSLHEMLDPFFAGIDGIPSAIGALVWIALGLWAVGSYIIYLPLKRLFAERTELENVWPEVLGELAENLRAGMGVESALDAVANARSDRMGEMLRQAVTEMHDTSFTEAMRDFAERSRSPMISRVVSILNVALVSSGSFSETLELLSEEFWEIYLLRKERIAKTKGTADFILWSGALICPALLGFIVAVFGSGTVGSFQLVIELGILNQMLLLYVMVLGAAGVLMQSVILQTMRTALLRIPLYMLLANTTLLVALKLPAAFL